MRVILRDDVATVGHKGDVVDVADGFARNFLVPKGLAMAASPGALAQAAAMREGRAKKQARNREAAEQVAKQLTAAVVRVTAKAGADGRLFGAVTPADLVAAVLTQTGVELDRRRVQPSEPIKALGAHEVPVRLHPEVEARVRVEVVPRTS